MTPSRAPARARTVLVVPHTHWDREWYRTFESYRYRLLRALDGVLASELPYFLLDGQTVVADDYLALRPDRADELRARIRDGRLGFGPWYVLVDEFLVSGEALVRNLAAGRAAMRAMGVPADAPAVGYLPDMFGHVAQMPQLLRGFGLDRTVVWRGATPAAPRFAWAAPDGSEVLAAWLPKGYYQTLFMEDLGDAERRKQLDAYVEAFGDQDPVWLLSGADHMAPRADLADQLARLGADGTLDARVAPLHAIFAGPAPAARMAGELRAALGMAYILPGVLSARTYLKQANHVAQRELERWAEPLAARAWWGGHAWDGMGAALTHAWKTLMLNHPHDSICGCSIDQVHREMIPRFDAVGQVAAEIAADAIRVAPKPGAEPAFYVANPTGWAWDGWVELEVLWPRPKDGAPPPEAVTLRGPDGAALDLVVHAVEDTDVFRAEIDFNPDWFPVRRFRVAARVALPAAGGVVLRAEAAERLGAAPAAAVTAGAGMIENARLVLRVADGRLALRDKATGREWADVAGFLDEGDAGDEYNFSPLAGDLARRATLVSAEVVEAAPHRATLEVRWKLEVPASLTPDRSGRTTELVDLAPVARFTLEAGRAVVDVETTIDQRAQDHRLRLVVGGAPAGAEVWTDGTFGVFRREPAPKPALPVPKGTEAVMAEFPQGLFTALVGADGAGLAVAAEGLHEASVEDDAEGRALALTLIRAVGWLSRDDLRTRGGGAGPRFETPEAQCLGVRTFRHALIPLAAGWADAVAPAHQWNAPPRAWQADGPAVPGALATWDAPGVVLSAMKRSENGKHLVVRGYNPGPEPIATTLRVHVPHGGVAAANLAEEAQGAFAAGDAHDATFGPYQIRTWLIATP